MIEFEIKAPVEDPLLPGRLAQRGVLVSVVQQVDAYFRHPQRDFAKTDEALRLRSVDGRAEITYKGPKVDKDTKTRLELTSPVGDYATMEGILTALGFEPVAVVRKRRQTYQVDRFEVDLDEVEGLGAYVEVEALVPDAKELDHLKAQAFALLAELGAGSSERRSYLELLLARQGRA